MKRLLSVYISINQETYLQAIIYGLWYNDYRRVEFSYKNATARVFFKTSTRNNFRVQIIFKYLQVAHLGTEDNQDLGKICIAILLENCNFGTLSKKLQHKQINVAIHVANKVPNLK